MLPGMPQKQPHSALWPCRAWPAAASRPWPPLPPPSALPAASARPRWVPTQHHNHVRKPSQAFVGHEAPLVGPYWKFNALVMGVHSKSNACQCTTSFRQGHRSTFWLSVMLQPTLRQMPRGMHAEPVQRCSWHILGMSLTYACTRRSWGWRPGCIRQPSL